MTDRDTELLRRSFALAAEAQAKGNYPFGALLANANGEVLAEATNNAVETCDCTAHAELRLVQDISVRLSAEQISDATLFSSAEPCAMCAGAIVWSGVRRIVFGIGAARLYDFMGRDPGIPGLYLPARTVFESANCSIELIGPALDEEVEDLYRSLAGWHLDA